MKLVAVSSSRMSSIAGASSTFKETLQDLVKGTHTCQTYESTLSGNSLEYRVQSKVLFVRKYIHSNLQFTEYRIQNPQTLKMDIQKENI